MSNLTLLNLEISNGSGWVSLNDHTKYVVNAQNTRDQVRKTWRTVKATSPVLSGDYLVHAVPEMVSETVSVWVHGTDYADLHANQVAVSDLFEQYSYQLRWTYNTFYEVWDCQLAETATSSGQVYAHNIMAQLNFTVPRYPEIVTGVNS